MADPSPIYISVDIETAGPNPGTYSMLSIGACTVHEPQKTFYIELQPVNENFVEETLLISRLSWRSLQEKGLPPEEGMGRFADWLQSTVTGNSECVFVAFNAPFDWMFVNEYFHRYLGYNPFGHKALDIKALYMGVHGVCWAETGMKNIAERYLNNQQLTHHALRDALDQAVIFRKLLGVMKEQP
jgi:DNA polymerase III epsilon subunit-like protein